jgi:hypothetical protein
MRREGGASGGHGERLGTRCRERCGDAARVVVGRDEPVLILHEVGTEQEPLAAAEGRRHLGQQRGEVATGAIPADDRVNPVVH